MREPSTGKGRFDLITPFGLDRLAKWYELGSIKYADRNWEKGMPFSRYIDSAERHINNFKKGLVDEDHLAAAVWNLLAVIHHQELGQMEFDDLPHYMTPREQIMRRLTVLVDFDDVLFPLLPKWINALNTKHNLTVSQDDVNAWDLETIFPELSVGEIFAPLNEEGFWDDLTPIDGSVYYLARIIKDGHFVYIATDTYYKHYETKTELLLEHFPFLACDDIVRTSNKQLLNADVLVDDGLHNLVGGDYVKLLFDYPHNRAYDAEAEGIIRVHNWKEIYQEIRRLASKRCRYYSMSGSAAGHACIECRNSFEQNGCICCTTEGYGGFSPYAC